jgi:hypothetical protein
MVRKQILTEVQWLKSVGMSSSKSRTAGSTTIAAPIEFFCPITHDIMIEPVTTCGKFINMRFIVDFVMQIIELL